MFNAPLKAQLQQQWNKLLSDNAIPLECHDCGEETELSNKFGDAVKEEFSFCPRCGSKNVSVGE